MIISSIPNTPFQQRMARGHRIQQGHELDAVQVTEDGILWHTVRKCCGEPIPETVQTWADHVPTPDKPTCQHTWPDRTLEDTSTSFTCRDCGSEVLYW